MSEEQDYPITESEYTSLMTHADDVINKLEAKLSNVSVKISAASDSVVEAVKVIFGEQYIKQDGSTEITFDMYKQLVKSLKDVGKMKVEEYV